MRPRIYDGDAHIVEPVGVWQERVPARFKDRAPKLVKQPDGNDAWSFEGGERTQPVIMLLGTPGISPVNWSLLGTSYERMRPGAYDPKARLADMDTDFIYGQVLHPSIAISGPAAFSKKDVELQEACTRAYNDWMSEFCSVNPDRLLGLALVPACGIDRAVAELRRAREMKGICGVQLGAWPSGRAHPHPDDDRFWAEAEALGMPVIIHVSIGGGGEGEPEAVSLIYTSDDMSLVLASINLERSARGIMEALSYLLIGGVLERFPKLRVVGTETGIGWIPYYLEQTDDNFLRHRFWAKAKLTMLPSDYYKRQCFNTFQVDTVGVRNRQGILDNILWSSDYPHSGADWPNSVVTIERDLAGVPEDERQKILSDNCQRAFGLT
jgi:predicted TIM-barrel fold metal-dependent hydrolase